MRRGYFSPTLFHRFVGEKTKSILLQGSGYGTALILLTHRWGLALSSSTDGLKNQRWVPDPACAGLTCNPTRFHQRQRGVGWRRRRLR